MSNTWEAGATPWLRRHQTNAGYGIELNPIQCLFCGGQTVKRSSTDHEEDPGRIELYCDNGSCDAREMILLVRRDGAEAGLRADVRALRLVDEGKLDVHASYPPEMRSYSLAEMAELAKGTVERRTRKYAPSEE
ncbi:hypothetical protein [Streptomyces sp. MBT28]|uniref:hypothetical protein n=1 Tax=Streptomyces sp. MBT28 TaxID=1488357 RepID=UPI000695F139|nr:hypothetical protein [Streptomyces sp. MBT28]